MQTLNTAQIEQIKATYKSFRAQSKTDLLAEYNRVFRVNGANKGTPKADLISDLLCAKYGEKRVQQAFN